MIIQSDPTPAAAAAECAECGTLEHRFLHTVRHRSMYRRLCTSCVLRLHLQYFCPTCFSVYSSPPPASSAEFVPCSRCYSFSHVHCLGPGVRSSYVCPLCLKPNSPIFTLKKVKEVEDLDVRDADDKDYRVIDRKSAKILLAAAKIAAALMTKNAAEASANAERRAREAAVARKRARDALEHVAYLVAQENLKKREIVVSVSEDLRSRGGNSLENSGNVIGKVGSVIGRFHGSNEALNVNSSVPGRLDGSNGVVAAMNAVELREGGEKMGFEEGNLEVGVPVNDVVPMDVEVKNELICEDDLINDPVEGSEREGSGRLIDLENHDEKGEQVSDGQTLLVPIENKVEQMDNSPVVATNNEVSEK